MKSSIKTFLTMVKYEFVRITRNKIILFLLIFFPVAMILILSSVSHTGGYSAAIFKDGLDTEVIEVLDVISGHISNDLIEVNTQEEGIDLLKNGKVFFLISFDSESDPISAKFYFDNSSIAVSEMVNNLQKFKVEYAYNSLTEFLSHYGITISEAQFNLVDFEPIHDGEITYKQKLFSMQIGTVISIIIMLGLAFSISRDNETGVVRQISYTPIGVNKYLLSKITPYFLISIFQTALLIMLGWWLHGIDYAASFGLLMLISALFILSNIALGLIVCSVKNQTASAFLSIGTILLPIFAVAFTYLSSFPEIIQLFLQCLPLTLFILLIKNLAFNGVILYPYLYSTSTSLLPYCCFNY